MATTPPFSWDEVQNSPEFQNESPQVRRQVMGRYWKTYAPAIAESLAVEKGIPGGLVGPLLMRESSGDPFALSSAGAIGLMQLMPATAQKWKVDPTNPQQNIIGGISELKEQLDAFGGNVPKAVGAYHSGAGNVQDAIKAGGEQWVSHLGPQGQAYVQALGNLPLTSASMSPIQPALPPPEPPPYPWEQVAQSKEFQKETPEQQAKIRANYVARYGTEPTPMTVKIGGFSRTGVPQLQVVPALIGPTVEQQFSAPSPVEQPPNLLQAMGAIGALLQGMGQPTPGAPQPPQQPTLPPSQPTSL